MVESPSGEAWKIIVVRTNRRKEMLKAPHGSMIGGHLSLTKTCQLLNRLFTWPGMTRHVKHSCRSCEKCQMSVKSGTTKAPLQLSKIALYL